MYLKKYTFPRLTLNRLLNSILSPVDVYRRQIDAGELRHDVAQRNVIVHLESLFQFVISNQGKRKWYDKFLDTKPESPNGYYLWGGVGTGKSMLMDLFHHTLPEGQARRIHFHRFMQWVHNEKNQIKEQQDPLAIVAEKFAVNARILCLDEFSVTDITDAMILSELLKHMFKQSLILVTTSNTKIEDLYKDGLQRNRFLPAIKLLQENTTEINVDSGNDYRMDYLKDDAIYHTPLGDTADRDLERCFNNLAGNQVESDRTINIIDREIEIVATAAGTIWFEFSALCQTNRSNADYIEIARQFHTVLISNIPPLDKNSDDAVRRFVELVDELYDRNVNLIVSSAKLPGEIYTGKRLEKPFKRTVSRLNEMSSHEYLARPHLS